MRLLRLILCSGFIICTLLTYSQILVTNVGSSLTIRAGSALHAEGLVLEPSADFTIKEKNELIIQKTISHPAGYSHIDRVFSFSNPTDKFIGSIHMNYHDSDLHILNEGELELNIHNGLHWHPIAVSHHDRHKNHHRSAISGINLQHITLVDKNNILKGRTPLPVHILSNPVMNGQLNLLVDEACQLILLNGVGQLMERKIFAKGWHTWDIGKYPKGLYLLADSMEKSQTLKVLVH